MFTNPYVLLGGGLAMLAIAGTIGYQNHQIHHYHTLYECAENGNCAKTFKGDTLPSLRQTISGMTEAQNHQTKIVDNVVTKVVKAPGDVQTKTVIKEIHDAPQAATCTSPEFPQDVKDSY